MSHIIDTKYFLIYIKKLLLFSTKLRFQLRIRERLFEKYGA